MKREDIIDALADPGNADFEVVRKTCPSPISSQLYKIEDDFKRLNNDENQ